MYRRRSLMFPGSCFCSWALVYPLSSWTCAYAWPWAGTQAQCFSKRYCTQEQIGKGTWLSLTEAQRHIPARAVISLTHCATMEASRSGMTHLFGCHDNVLPSMECCSEQPCCLAAVGWWYSKKNNVRESAIVISLHCVDLCKMRGAAHLKWQRSAAQNIAFVWKGGYDFFLKRDWMNEMGIYLFIWNSKRVHLISNAANKIPKETNSGL